MQIGYFTERPYRWLPEELILKNRAFFAVSNQYFDHEKAADDYHYYLDEYCYAEDLGFEPAFFALVGDAHAVAAAVLCLEQRVVGDPRRHRARGRHRGARGPAPGRRLPRPAPGWQRRPSPG